MSSGEPFDLSGRSPAVLLLHGFTGTPWEVRPVADALHARGYACVAPLLPGHGQTPEALSTTRWSDWVSATDEVLDRLLARHPRVVVLGMSLGGLLALQAAGRYQDRGVVGVVTLACALRLARWASWGLFLARQLGSRLPDWYVPKFLGSDVQDPVVRRANPGYTRHPLRAARELLVGQAAVRAMLPSLRVPLLAIHGLVDRVTPVRASMELVRMVGSREAILVLAPRSGHLLAVDRDREEVARQVCAFVGRLAAGEDDPPAR